MSRESTGMPAAGLRPPRGAWSALAAGLSAPGLFVAALALLSLLLQVRFLLYSDSQYLAAVRMQDDSFYYLQPAWMFKTTGMFTFDGEMPTYGFQPLWMLVLAGLAYVSPDKLWLMRAALSLGAALYCAAGLLLYGLSRRLLSGWKAAIAPALWLVNPSLSAAYTTGKENALYALLLLAALVYTYRILDRDHPPAADAIYGGLCGLLALCRVNSLLFVALLLAAAYGVGYARPWCERATRLGLALVGLLAVVLPWAVYAQARLGGVFPNSGTQKLIGAQAALAIYARQLAPWLPESWPARLLPAAERPFLLAPDTLVIPSASFVAGYALIYIPRLALGDWVGQAVAGVLGRGAGWLWLPQLAALVSLAALLVYRLAARPRGLGRRPGAVNPRIYIPAAALFAFAALNALANGFLLPNHVHYATWYAVPETLAWVLAAALACVLALGALRSSGYALIFALMLVAAPASAAWRETRPRAYVEGGGSLHEVWEARPWMLAHLPPGARIGAMSSGLLGYLSEDRTVVNLDGLANSPEYVDTIWREHLLHAAGLAPAEPLWDYIRARRIEYIANPEWDATLGRRPFLGVVPVGSYEIVYRGANLIQWGEPEGSRRFIIVRLHY